ncbi:hypothetical protein ES703_98429 [subsurface metagenome]
MSRLCQERKENLIFTDLYLERKIKIRIPVPAQYPIKNEIGTVKILWLIFNKTKSRIT